MAVKTIFCGLLAAAVWAGAAGGQDPPADGEGAPTPSMVQEKVREWVRAQKVLSEEAADWEEDRKSMEDLNALRKREIGQIDALIAAAGERLADAEKRRGALAEEEAALRGSREEMKERVDVLEKSLRAQVVRFPPPLLEKVGAEVDRLENPDADTPLQNRFRDVLVILGAAGQFQDSLTVDTEIRDFGTERVEVDVLYLGFSGAWYVDREGKRAGSGMPGADGWEWSADDGIAGRVQEAIAMHHRKVSPGYIGLPFKNSNGAASK